MARHRLPPPALTSPRKPHLQLPCYFGIDHLGVEYGLLGLLAFLYFLGRVGFRLMLHQGRSLWALGGVGLLLAFVIHNFFDVTFPSLALEMGFLLGISLAERRRSQVRRASVVGLRSYRFPQLTVLRLSAAG